MQLVNQLDAQRHQLVVQRQRIVAVVDRNCTLPDDISRVRARNHMMQRDARLALSIHKHPVDRRASPISRQQRRMQIERAKRS